MVEMRYIFVLKDQHRKMMVVYDINLGMRREDDLMNMSSTDIAFFGAPIFEYPELRNFQMGKKNFIGISAWSDILDHVYSDSKSEQSLKALYSYYEHRERKHFPFYDPKF